MSPQPSPTMILPVEVSPEAELRGLFRAEQELEKRLAEVRAAQRPARAAYAKKHNLLVLPSLAKLKAIL